MEKRVSIKLIAGILIIVITASVVYVELSNPPIIIENIESSCKVQDNSNYSHWCEFPCGNDLIQEALKCQGGS